MKLAVAGFGPFPGVPFNPTELIVSRIEQRPDLSPWKDVHFQILPVEYEAGGEAVVRLLDTHRPDVLLLLGVACGATKIRLERFARNVNDCPVADTAGVVCSGEPIRSGGPDALQTPFILPALRRSMAELGYPLDISNHAGAYLCNHVYYTAMDYAARHALATRVLFVHMPMPALPTGSDANCPGSLKELELATRHLIALPASA